MRIFAFILAFALSLSDCVAQASFAPVDLSALPTPAAAPPPPVNATGAIGNSTQFARADHTHVSSVFKTIKSTTDGTGTVAWTYPIGFFTDVPVIELTVEDASTQDMVAKVQTNTALGGTAKIISSTNLPGVSLNLLNFNVYSGTVPIGTKLHVYAAKASQ